MGRICAFELARVSIDIRLSTCPMVLARDVEQPEPELEPEPEKNGRLRLRKGIQLWKNNGMLTAK